MGHVLQTGSRTRTTVSVNAHVQPTYDGYLAIFRLEEQHASVAPVSLRPFHFPTRHGVLDPPTP